MSYDFDDCADRSPPRYTGPPANPKDLETLVTALSLAGIFLHDERGEFTRDELIGRAVELVGAEVPIDPRDAAIVLDGMGYCFERRPGGTLALR